MDNLYVFIWEYTHTQTITYHTYITTINDKENTNLKENRGKLDGLRGGMGGGNKKSNNILSDTN